MMQLEGAHSGAVRAVFEDLGGYGAVAREQNGAVEGPLVGHLQRTNIQLAAIPVFASKGLAETTVNDLLAAAKVSRRTFYKYFNNKMDVLEGIYQTAVSLLLARFRDMQYATGSSPAWLRSMVALFFDYHLAVGPIIRLMQEEALRADSPLAAHRQRAHLEMVELLTERLHVRALRPAEGCVAQAAGLAAGHNEAINKSPSTALARSMSARLAALPSSSSEAASRAQISAR